MKISEFKTDSERLDSLKQMRQAYQNQNATKPPVKLFNQFGYAGTFPNEAAARKADQAMNHEPEA